MWGHFYQAPANNPVKAPPELGDERIELLARVCAADILRYTITPEYLPGLSARDLGRLANALDELATGLELNAGQVGNELFKKARYSQVVTQQVTE
jgi:hypothetical protein